MRQKMVGDKGWLGYKVKALEEDIEELARGRGQYGVKEWRERNEDMVIRAREVAVK